MMRTWLCLLMLLALAFPCLAQESKLRLSLAVPQPHFSKGFNCQATFQNRSSSALVVFPFLVRPVYLDKGAGLTVFPGPAPQYDWSKAVVLGPGKSHSFKMSATSIFMTGIYTFTPGPHQLVLQYDVAVPPDQMDSRAPKYKDKVWTGKLQSEMVTVHCKP